jgi:hypothetical protein
MMGTMSDAGGGFNNNSNNNNDNNDDRGYSLDDYIYEMEARAMSTNNSTTSVVVDSSAINNSAITDGGSAVLLLAQKEKDLILAAELGKALLDQNELLGRQNERLAEDFSHKLEVSYSSSSSYTYYSRRSYLSSGNK